MEDHHRDNCSRIIPSALPIFLPSCHASCYLRNSHRSYLAVSFFVVGIDTNHRLRVDGRQSNRELHFVYQLSWHSMSIERMLPRECFFLPFHRAVSFPLFISPLLGRFSFFPFIPFRLFSLSASLSLSLSLSAPSSFFISSSRHRLIIARGPEFHFALIECRATTLRVEPRVESTFPSLDTRRIHDSSGKISGYSNCLDGRQFRASGSAENARPLSDALSSTRVLSRRVTAAA